MTMISLKIKTGDVVRVLRGKDAGKTAKIVAVLPVDEKVVVEGLNPVFKHVKPRQSGQKGQRVTISAPLRIANVQVVCPQCKKGTRVALSRENGIRQRMCKKCNAIIE
ncbi:MAG: 50S ribosomal protein L24 [Candidatus Andersenbacteria bacterium RIFCSPHIGHO2_12_FULL_45_11b]|uniref:Large ribosomal subunit protein uL24 n=1 Tax=Candidatus Andersenbacteria bacterium RIFCSPHIGHO2_12_FULL_45_11b TaxID=1797282 RepID=A0A1G1X7P8_9BACT|nr:MAG: 50S ribosomal protein L24 [Candidatus Andersenbacteria bacterium RIFCSPHIGHO2_12_FULL_45_11b]